MLKLFYQQIQQPPQLCFVAPTSIPMGQTTFEHTHNFNEVFIVLSGEGIHHINKQRLHVKKGHFFLIRETDTHCFQASSNSNLVIMNLSFLPSWWKNFLALLPRNSPFFSHLKTPLSPFLLLPSSTLLEVESLMLSAGAPQSSAPNALIHFLNQAILLFQNPPASTSEKEPPPWLSKVAALMEEDRFLEEKIPFFQKKSSRSPEHFSRQFRSYFACSPTDYHNRVKIKKAQKLLIQTTEKVITISDSCGFHNLSHFQKQFLKFSQCPPRIWRERQHRSLVPSSSLRP